jgi:hypothetical protein
MAHLTPCADTPEAYPQGPRPPFAMSRKHIGWSPHTIPNGLAWQFACQARTLSQSTPPSVSVSVHQPALTVISLTQAWTYSVPQGLVHYQNGWTTTYFSISEGSSWMNTMRDKPNGRSRSMPVGEQSLREVANGIEARCYPMTHWKSLTKTAHSRLKISHQRLHTQPKIWPLCMAWTTSIGTPILWDSYGRN